MKGIGSGLQSCCPCYPGHSPHEVVNPDVDDGNSPWTHFSPRFLQDDSTLILSIMDRAEANQVRAMQRLLAGEIGLSHLRGSPAQSRELEKDTCRYLGVTKANAMTDRWSQYCQACAIGEVSISQKQLRLIVAHSR